MITNNSPYLFGQPTGSPVERYAMENMIDSQAPWYKQAAQIFANPVSSALAGVAADRSFAAMDQNEKVLDQLKAAGLPVTTDRYGNYIPAGGDAGLLASFGRSMGFGGTGGAGGAGGGGLMSFFGDSGVSQPSGHYGGYVTDASGGFIRAGDGFLTYGSGPASSNVVSTSTGTYDLSRD
jgi:hypothetical protein